MREPPGASARFSRYPPKPSARKEPGKRRGISAGVSLGTERIVCGGRLARAHRGHVLLRHVVPREAPERLVTRSEAPVAQAPRAAAHVA